MWFGKFGVCGCTAHCNHRSVLWAPVWVTTNITEFPKPGQMSAEVLVSVTATHLVSASVLAELNPAQGSESRKAPRLRDFPQRASPPLAGSAALGWGISEPCPVTVGGVRPGKGHSFLHTRQEEHPQVPSPLAQKHRPSFAHCKANTKYRMKPESLL